MPKQERTTLQNMIDESILDSITVKQEASQIDGTFTYVSDDDKELQTYTFDTLMESCAENEVFMKTMLALYQDIKGWHRNPTGTNDTGLKLKAFTDSIDAVLLGGIEFCAKDEHGVQS